MNEINDDGKLRRKFTRKRANAKKNGTVSMLTYSEFVGLMREAGIKSSQLGPTGYHLARYGDSGPYAVGNCRFVTFEVNQKEKKAPDSAVISRGLHRYYANNPGSFTGRKHREDTKEAIGRANSVSQKGERNSQFGRAWVTNGTIDKKIDQDKVDFYLSLGWGRGRKKIGPVA